MFGVATHTDQNYRFLPSKLGVAYNALLMIVVFICTYFAMNVSYFLDFASRSQLEKITDTIQTLFIIGTSLFILILYCIRQEQVIKIANDLRQSIDTSSILCCKKTYKKKLKNLVKAIKIIIFFNAAITSICVIAMPTFTLDVLLYFVSVPICNVIINTLIMQYYTIVLTIIAHLFDVLNSSLAESTNYKIEHLNISFMQKYGLQTKLKKLSKCRDFFTSLSRLSKKISKFMETIMLLCITNIFLTLIIYGFYVVKPLIVGKNVLASSILIRSFTQLVFSIVSTVLLVKAGSSVVNKTKRTGEIVNETLHKEGFTCHPDVAKLMYLFSNYLLHAKVRFGVCNLFTLDESLLILIAGSITMNLVILLQFKQGQKT